MKYRTSSCAIAVRLNNVGAAFLLQGRYSEARSIFAQALKVTKVMMLLMRRKQSVAAHNRDSSELSCLLSNSMHLALSQNSLLRHSNIGPTTAGYVAGRKQGTSTSTITTENELLATPDRVHILESMSHYFIFTDPILVNPHDISPPASPCQVKRGMMKLTVILVFNMALSHHLKAMNSYDGIPSNRSLDLQSAFSLYELSCKTQIQHDIKLSEIHAMAHINNLGQIAAARGNKVAARQIFRLLLNRLILYMESTSDKERRRHRAVEEGFRQNTSLAILQDPVTAPAA
jgi:hypothetical protein